MTRISFSVFQIRITISEILKTGTAFQVTTSTVFAYILGSAFVPTEKVNVKLLSLGLRGGLAADILMITSSFVFHISSGVQPVDTLSKVTVSASALLYSSTNLR